MKKLLSAILAISLVAIPSSALAGAGNFALANKTGSGITALSIRRSGTAAWRTLGASVGNGARTTVAFQDPDCAFDIQAKLADGQSLTYSGVNLCDVATVTLNRSGNGNQWVDYD